MPSAWTMEKSCTKSAELLGLKEMTVPFPSKKKKV